MHKTGIFCQGKSLILEAIADAEADADSIEPASREGIGRTPVQGDVQRDSTELDLRADLTQKRSVKLEDVAAVSLFVIHRTQLHTGTGIEMEDAGVAEREIIQTGNIPAFAADKSQIHFSEIVAHTILVGHLGAITKAGAESTRLRGSDYSTGEQADENN